MINQHAQAFILSPNPVAYTSQGEIASFARKNRLPSIYANNEYVHAGGLTIPLSLIRRADQVIQ